MGRRRNFDEQVVVQAAAGAFLRAGYEGTSIEELVTATGLLRGSLYQAFGSKRGLFQWVGTFYKDGDKTYWNVRAEGADHRHRAGRGRPFARLFLTVADGRAEVDRINTRASR